MRPVQPGSRGATRTPAGRGGWSPGTVPTREADLARRVTRAQGVAVSQSRLTVEGSRGGTGDPWGRSGRGWGGWGDGQYGTQGRTQGK